MAEEKRRQPTPRPRQQWRPPWILVLVQRLWMVAFGLAKIAVGAAATVAIIFVVCGLVFVGTLGDYLQNDILPNAGQNLDDIDLEQTSVIHYVDSSNNIQTLQEIYTTVDRKWVTLDEIPEDLIHAAVAIEDHRFYEHQGVDWVTTIKACVRMFFGGDSSIGGSTITQQLIKNITGENSITVQRKVLEIFRATQLEKRYDKDTVMEYYLNYIFLGEGCYGVKTAAERYFGKELQNLTLEECASLISITNNPSMYDPYLNLQGNRNRQKVVLGAMLEYGWITQAEYDEALTHELVSKRAMDRLLADDAIDNDEYAEIVDEDLISPVVLRQILADRVVTQEEYDAVMAQHTILKSGIDLEDQWAVCESCGYEGTVGTLNHTDGLYYCPDCGTKIEVVEDVSQDNYTWFVDTVIKDVAADFAAEDGLEWSQMDDEQKAVYYQKIQRGGYHIYATIDMDVQRQVDAIYQDRDQIPAVYSGQLPQSAMVVIDNRTGDIVAIAGGVGEKTGYLDWSRATDSRLQTGSSIKPLAVYAPAFELEGISPNTAIEDMPLTYNGGAYPRNDTGTYARYHTIYNGIINSVNAVSVHTLNRIGLRYSFDFAKEQFGLSGLVESYDDGYQIHSDIDFGPLGLGAQTFGISVRDMATAFASFPNNGVYRKARTYTKVYDSEGNLVLDNVQQTHQAVSVNTANYMNVCLYHATAEGTGTAADLTGMATYGKTGTTGDDKDRWYCGYTGYYTAAVWFGFDEPERIRLGADGSWTNPAARLFRKVMQPLHDGKERIVLHDTSGMYSSSMCMDSGKFATDACFMDVRGSRTESGYYYPGDLNAGSCDKHVMVDYCSGGGVATEFCRMFAEDDLATISRVSLVKMTQSELEELKMAGNVGLNSRYLQDNYVYLINADGTDASFKGFYGNINQNIDAPYMVCPVHNQQTWDEYQESLKPTEPETVPPTEPEAGTAPEPAPEPTPEPAPEPAPEPIPPAGGTVADDSAVG